MQILCLFAATTAATSGFGGTLAAQASPATSGFAAKAVTVKDEGKLSFVKSSGSTLIDEGPITGTIPGKVRIHFTYDGNPTVIAQITIFGHNGSIQAHCNGRLSSPTNPNPSFAGTIAITGGSGRYAHIHGNGHLYGVFHRRSYAMVVQTEGTLHY